MSLPFEVFVVNRYVIYTALFGNYDKLVDPEDVCADCDYLCFTDQENIKSNVWSIIVIKDCDLSANLMNRKYKILPHIYLPSYESSLYVDANVGLKRCPIKLFERLSPCKPFFAPRHPFRNCIYQEAEECYRNGKISYAEMLRLFSFLNSSNYPSNNGLHENNILLRKHNEKNVANLMERWFCFVKGECSRDQLSLKYLAWNEGFNIDYLKESSKKPNPYFYFRKHLSQVNKGWFKNSVISLSAHRADNYFYYFLARFVDFMSMLLKKLRIIHRP